MEIKRSVTLKGKLSSNLKYKPYPTEEFSTGRWFVAVASVVYEANEKISAVCEITTNFVVGQKYTDKFEAISYEQPLATVLIRADANQTGRVLMGKIKTNFLLR